MWFLRKNGKNGLRKLDAVVTGLIVGSAIAAVYGLKRRKAAKAAQPEGAGLLTRVVNFFKNR